MGTGKHEAKKQEILASAFRIWGNCGYRNTSLAGLAAAHNMTKQAIYRYFPSKSALEEAMEEQATEVYTATAAAMMEHLRNVPAGNYELLCMPLKYIGAGGDGAPARTMLRTL